MRQKRDIGVWFRAATLIVVLLASAFALYGRLVCVETRLMVVEKRVEAIYGRLFGRRVAEKP